MASASYPQTSYEETQDLLLQQQVEQLKKPQTETWKIGVAVLIGVAATVMFVRATAPKGTYI